MLPDSKTWRPKIPGLLLPLQLVVRGQVLGGDVGQVPEHLAAVDGEAGEQDELLPSSTEQQGVVLDGQLAEERQLLDPRDLTKQQLVGQTTQQRKQLHLSHLVPDTHNRGDRETRM